MKNTTIEIKAILDDTSVINQLMSFNSNDPAFNQYEMTHDEVIDKYLFAIDILKEEIRSGRFDQLAQTKRVHILNILKAIVGANGYISQILNHVDILYDVVLTSNILTNRVGRTDFISEHKDLNKLKRKYLSLIEDLDVSHSHFDFIENNKESFDSALRLAEERSYDIQELLDNSKSFQSQLDEQFTSFQNKLVEVKETQEEIEEKRLSITTFSNNIEEYKASISKLEGQFKLLIARENEIVALIKSAHEALKLGSTVGISTAFSNQYDKANEINKKGWWVFGAILFLISAIGLTIWIVSDEKSADKLAVVIGRIVAVAISIAGAIFCSRQYTKQKQIAEDYAYKAVLAKSIVAFTEEIGASNDNGDTHVGIYLNKVLTEIHKDPLRERGTTRTKRGFSDKQVEQITDVVKTVLETTTKTN